MRKKINRAMKNILAVMFVCVFSLLSQDKGIGIKWIFVEGGEDGDFYISATEITFEQYDKFCEATEHEKPNGEFGRGKQPVINVNYEDAEAFCEWLSKETDKTVRLPNAPEWIFAAQGGKKTNKYQYSGSNSLNDVAWYFDNSDNKPHEVAAKNPNELGIYDMSGNVWEWCDTYSIRSGGNWGYGGSWNLYDIHCRIPTRIVFQAEYKHNNLGFRVLKEP